MNTSFLMIGNAVFYSNLKFSSIAYFIEENVLNHRLALDLPETLGVAQS